MNSWDPPRMLGRAEKLRLVALTPKQISWAFSQIEQASEYAYDIETTHPTANEFEYNKPRSEAKILGVSFCWALNRGAYIPVFRDSEGTPYFRDPVIHNQVIGRLKKVLTNRNTFKIAQNGKFDNVFLNFNFGIEVDLDFDTMLAHWIIDENGEHSNWAGIRVGTNHGLEKIAVEYLGDAACCNIEYDLLQQEVTNRDPRYKRYETVPVDILGKYGASDSIDTYACYLHERKILEERGQLDFFLNFEMLKTKILTRAEVEGIPVYTEKVGEVTAYLDAEMFTNKAALTELVGFEFDPAHTGNTAYVLFDVLKLDPVGGRGKSGDFSTKKAILESYAQLDRKGDVPPEVEVPRKIIAYRNLSRMKTNYTESMHKYIDPKKKIFHMNYKQHGTDTGRCSAALIQSMPSEKKGGKILKGLFHAGDGNVFVFADFSQIELRVMAELSGDPAMVAAFQAGEDIHTAAAKRILGVTDEWIADPANKAEFAEIRRRAKTINFGILFGEGARKLSESLGIEYKEAIKLIASYFEAFPGVEAAIQKIYRQAEETGQIRNMFGRIRHLEDTVELASINVPHYRDMLISDDERNLYNGRMPGQGEFPSCFRGRKDYSIHNTPPTISGHLRMDIHKVIAGRRPPKSDEMRSKLASSPHLHSFSACMKCPLLASCSWEYEISLRREKLQRNKRQAFSSWIQGTAVDGCFYSAGRIQKRIEAEKIPCHGTRSGLATMVLQIHDELGYRVAKSHAEVMGQIMKEEMERWPNEDFPNWRVPIRVDMSRPVDSWADAK